MKKFKRLNNEDNELIDIPNENIFMDIVINNNRYVAFTDNPNNEQLDMLFARVEIINGEEVLVSIDDTKEYEMVSNEFYTNIVKMEDN